jgi:ADP-dependent NAD(P)H-hydrate dehydratase / NAD(P)H-hydrate epimerase
MTLPSELYDAAQVRQLEARLIAAGDSGQALMERAGAAAYACLRQRWPGVKSIAVVCGGGNNGGDGFVVARHAQQDGLEVRVLVVGDTKRADARAFEPSLLAGCELIVDALLGIGVRAPLSAQVRAAIEAINAAHLPVLAIDLPSGLDPDTGRALPAVLATATITFIALKQGLFLGDGPDHAGNVQYESLGCDAAVARDLPPALSRLIEEDLRRALAPRSRQSHKGQFGKVVVVGGGTGMPGAVRLAAETALRVGAGLVTVASRPEHLQVVVGTRPELMFQPVTEAGDVAAAIAGAEVVLLGPGLGRDHWARVVLASTLAAVSPDTRLVVDADALNLIAEGVGLQRWDHWVLTPHPAEAARLLQVTTDDVQRDRMAAVRDLCAQRGGTVVLKGAGTLVGREGQGEGEGEGTDVRLCDRGNPGMAIPGMGDVLAGAIAGILAQGEDPFQAAAAGVYAHATAGDRCAKFGLRGMVAMDVALELRAVLAPLK